MNAKDFRFQARQALTGNWLLAAGATLIATLLGGVSSSNVNFSVEEEELILTPAMQQTLSEYLPLILVISGGIVMAAIAISIFLSNIVNVGYCGFSLKMYDGKLPEIKDLFSQFTKGIYLNTVKTTALRMLYVLGCYLLLIIPGIIAEYSYAMVPYILMDHPELSPKECLKASERMMEGNRWRLFCLQMSFIGWAILNGLTFGIGGLFLAPYQYTATAAFYREISKDTAPVAYI